MTAQGIRERCSGCGASVSMDALTCDYCGVASPHAVRAQKAHSEAELAQQEAELGAAQRILERSGTIALVWSLVGLLMCCLPIPSGVAVFLGLRARRIAAERGWIPPATATAGLVIGGVGLAAFALFAVLVGLEMRAVSVRKADLHALIDASAGEKTLTQHTACALAELRLLEDGYDGHSGNTLMDDFECAGRVEQDGDRAVLHALSLKPSSKVRIELNACLMRGARWRVDRLVPSDLGCEDPEPTSVEPVPAPSPHDP